MYIIDHKIEKYKTLIKIDDLFYNRVIKIRFLNCTECLCVIKGVGYNLLFVKHCRHHMLNPFNIYSIELAPKEDELIFKIENGI